MTATTRGKIVETCKKCGLKGSHNEFCVPEGPYLLNEWLCLPCYEKYMLSIKRFNEDYIQPERSKREDDDDEIIKKVLSSVAKMPHRYKSKEEYDLDHH